MLRISEAATRLGVTPVTLRRWEADGRIWPVRTPGGERRFPEVELDRVKAEMDASPTRRPGKHKPSGPQVADSPELLDDLEDDADLPMPKVAFPPATRPHQVQRRDVGDEITTLERADREARAARDRREREAARVADDEERRREAQMEKLRLDGLRQYGDMLAVVAGAPTEYRADVTRDLMSYVTPAQFPASASYHAYEYIKARVERILQPWRDEQEQEREEAAREVEKERRRGQREDLRAVGRAHADSETLFWDAQSRQRAAREVEDALKDEVRSDWTRDDVVALVDEVLGQWE